MRRFVFAAIVCTLIALPLAAQNTDIESLSGLQFNFGNPGARSLGMGGAFLGLADDASAAEANPAGLTILRKPEITIEGRNYQEQQVFTTSGTFPDLAAHRLQPLQPAHRRHVRQRRLSRPSTSPSARTTTSRCATKGRAGRPGAQRFHRRDQDRRPELLPSGRRQRQRRRRSDHARRMPDAAADQSVRLPRVHGPPVPQLT